MEVVKIVKSQLLKMWIYFFIYLFSAKIVVSSERRGSLCQLGYQELQGLDLVAHRLEVVSFHQPRPEGNVLGLSATLPKNTWIIAFAALIGTSGDTLQLLYLPHHATLIPSIYSFHIFLLYLLFLVSFKLKSLSELPILFLQDLFMIALNCFYWVNQFYIFSLLPAFGGLRSCVEHRIVGSLFCTVVLTYTAFFTIQSSIDLWWLSDEVISLVRNVDVPVKCGALVETIGATTIFHVLSCVSDDVLTKLTLLITILTILGPMDRLAIAKSCKEVETECKPTKSHSAELFRLDRVVADLFSMSQLPPTILAPDPNSPFFREHSCSLADRYTISSIQKTHLGGISKGAKNSNSPQIPLLTVSLSRTVWTSSQFDYSLLYRESSGNLHRVWMA